MARKRAVKASQYNNVIQLEQALVDNGRAYREGPSRKKTWTKHDIKHIKALTPPQREMIHDYIEGQNIIASGSAGTGKTFIGLYLALCDMLSLETESDRIIIVRSAVPTRDLGFTPGTLEEKAALYEAPYSAMFSELMGRPNTYQDMKDAGVVEFQTTSYIRGVTWDNAIIVVDECQSMTFHEINTIMTRLGRGSRIIMCGDLPQTDLRKKLEVTGMDKMLRVAARMRGFTNVVFTRHDIVRSEFVKQWITATEEEGD
jgi:phosphate starvation-inducible protein PhoH and related proteins